MGIFRIGGRLQRGIRRSFEEKRGARIGVSAEIKFCSFFGCLKEGH